MTVKRKPRPPSRKGKGPTPSSFKPGVSGNPGGRPRKAMAFADRVRERIDPDLVIDLALAVAEDEALAPHERLRELWPLIDRGFVKPPTNAHVSLERTDSNAETADYSKLSLDELRTLRELHAKALTAGTEQPEHRPEQPTVSVDDLSAYNRSTTGAE